MIDVMVKKLAKIGEHSAPDRVRDRLVLCIEDIGNKARAVAGGPERC